MSLSETPPDIDRHAPILGGNNRDVFAELDYDVADFAHLEAGVLAGNRFLNHR